MSASPRSALPACLPARLGRCAALLAASLWLSACNTTPWKQEAKVYQRESFKSTETYSRLFDANSADTCESARRALMSQGYVISTARADFVAGNKAFQPEPDVHVQISFNVVCAPESKAGEISTAYVNAIQDRYTLKKSASSASVGVSAIGSLSIPLGSSDDSMVKVASETIPAGSFYDGFFALMQRYLHQLATEE